MCGKSRKGKFMVKCRTSEKKLKVKRAKVSKWIRKNMHIPIRELIFKLNLKLQGKGDHENWFSPIINKPFTVDGRIRKRTSANKTLKGAGVTVKIP